MKCFPFLKTCGSQLDYIDKRHSNLIYVPDEVMRNAHSLEECLLDANQIKELPKNFFRLTKLRVLTLSDNELSYIPESIGNFNHLVDLDISKNHIEDIHYNIKFCNELRTLDLSNNPISRLPEGFSSLRNLTYLSLNDISLTELPVDFGSLSVLTRLELRDNCLKALPNSFSRLQHLELIDLGGNEFQEFPKPLGLLSELKILCMDNNELPNLPKEIGTLKSLQQLDVSENFLDVIGEEIGNLQSLTDLVLSQNSLDSLPITIGNLKELTVLKLDQNKLIALTSYIGNCTNLQELYLTENLLTKLPGTIGKLSKLTHLNVDRNNLLAIPPELTRCNKLAIMSFRDNHLRSLPDEIGSMVKLHVLDVSLNQLERLPLSIAQCPLKALWLSEIQSQSIVKLQRDTDDNTGEEFLTCYLLPQSGTEDDLNHENIIHDIEYKSNDRFSQALSTVPGDSDSINLRVLSSTSASDSKVRFTEDEQVPSNRISKELPKTRHPKFDKKAVDGHIIPKDVHTTKETKFAPSRLGSDTEQIDSKLNGKGTHHTKKVSETSYMSSDAESSDNPAIHENENCKANEFIQPHSLKRPALSSIAQHQSIHLTETVKNPINETKFRSHSDSRIKPVEAIPIVDEVVDKIHSSSKSSRNSNSNQFTKGSLQPADMNTKTKDFSAFPENTQNAQNIDNIPFHEVPHNINGEKEIYRCDRENVSAILNQVDFSNETDETEDTLDLKLSRKDTPHYTKKAKILETTTDGTKNEYVVKQIIDKLKSPAPVLSYSISNRSSDDGFDQENHNIKIRPGNNLQIAPTYDQVVSASALARGSNVPLGLHTSTSEYIETNIIIQRESGEPLGMSIAGGKGSSPYQPVFVSKITETGAANRCGLMVNDKIMEVNGQSMNNVDHAIAVSALKAAGNYIDLLILREVVVAPPSLASSFISPENYLSICDKNSEEEVDFKFETIKCDLIRDDSGLGFSIAGGKGSMKRDVSDQRYAFLESIFICKITPNGAADKCQMLQVGDQIIKINGIDIRDARHDQAVVLLSGSESIIHLEVQRQIIIPKSPSDFHDNTESSQFVSPDSENSSVCTSSFRDRETVKVVKGVGQLGLSICGGSDHYSHPFGIDKPGIFISKIASNGAAKVCGKLRVGDRIVSVNGNDLSKATHDEAIVYIRQASDELIFEIIHETPPPGLKKLTIEKEINENLGITIHGGSDEVSLNPDDQKDKGIFITELLPEGAAKKDGRLKVGDRLIEVNGRSFMGIPCRTANKILKEVSTHMEVLVCDGINAERIVMTPNSELLPSLNIPEKHAPIVTSSMLKLSPNNVHQSPLVTGNNSVPFSSHSPSNNSRENDSINYTSPSQTPISSSLNNEEQHLSFRSKRRFFEKEIGNKKN